MLNKRVLILSNNALSDSNSNGRTLKNFLGTESRELLAQFYIQNDTPDFSACARFFKAGDKDVLRAFFKGGSAGEAVTETPAAAAAASERTGKKPKKSPLTMLLRDFLWNRKRWRAGLLGWADAFAPEIILLQAGDSPFLYDLALFLCKRYAAALVIYNSEDYYFKNYNYFRNSGISGVLYPCFRHRLKRAVRRAIRYAALCIYNSEDLASCYAAVIPHKSEFVYTATQMTPHTNPTKEPRFSYLGNLGVGRHESLIAVGEALSSISPDYTLDVYGKIPSAEVENAFASARGISYRGVVSYSEVQKIIAQSMLVFHTESFSPFYCRDLRHGFSTKIADSLGSGTPLVLYAPPHLTCTKYLLANGCAAVVSDPDVLEGTLRTLISNEETRAQYVAAALATVAKNHRYDACREKFELLINEIEK